MASVQLIVSCVYQSLNYKFGKKPSIWASLVHPLLIFKYCLLANFVFRLIRIGKNVDATHNSPPAFLILVSLNHHQLRNGLLGLLL